VHLGVIILVFVVMAICALKNRGGGQSRSKRRSGTGNAFSRQRAKVLLPFVYWLVPLVFIYLIRDWRIDSIPAVPLAGLILFILTWRFFIPPWLAWRVCRPLGLFFPGRFFYYFAVDTPGTPQRFETLMRIAQRRISKHPPTPFSPDAWTTATHALLWEIRGNASKADDLLQAFDLCPPGIKTSRILRRYAFEELAWHAAKRGDWKTVQHRASLGVGRGARFFKLLAEMHLQHYVNRTYLLLAWMVSPLRLRAWPFVRPLLGMCDDNGIKLPGPEQPAPDRDPRRTHLDLLCKASQGEPVAMEEVFLLAQKWDEQWTGLEKENLLRRGMELGARNVLTITQTIEEMVLDELEELAAAADGAIPQEIAADMTDADLSYAARLGWRIRNRLYDDMNRAQALIKIEKAQPLAEEEIQEYWENWLHMQATVSRLCRILGSDELGTLWHAGLRSVAWNNPVNLYNGCGKRSAWISIIMFYWVVTISRQLEDEQAETANRGNMTICGYAAPRRFRSRLL
jgi:hypothetical protein